MKKMFYVVTITEYEAKDNYVDCVTELFESEEMAKQRVDDFHSKAIDQAMKHGGLDDGGELSGVYGYVIYYLNGDIVKVKYEEQAAKGKPTWSDKLNAIVKAVKEDRMSDKYTEIDLLSYEKLGEDGKKRVCEERFDYIDVTSVPYQVWFICGTGYENYSVGIGELTEESINRLYRCIL